MCVSSMPAATGSRPVKLGFDFLCDVMLVLLRRLLAQCLAVAAVRNVALLSVCCLTVAAMLYVVDKVEWNVGLLAMCLCWLLSVCCNG